ncbi:MAG TPA: hypothetical protein PLO40_07980 [Spirochaetota bacterium]|nr:hypothetical protein [Spirochaetota bacterium]HQH30050.1 hypothetical protein [Spirochaetota bacterium]
MSDIIKSFETVYDQIDTTYLSKKIPKFKYLLKGAGTNISNLMELLVRKSLLKEDLYNYDYADGGSSFFLPEEKNFMESDRPLKIYERLKATAYALDFLSASMPETVDEITEKYLENCREILDYMSFHNLSSSSAGINTKSLREIYNRALSNQDEAYKKVVIDSMKLLSDNFYTIQTTTEEITKYKKEKYKYHFRYKVFPILPQNMNEKLFKENQAQFLKNLEDFMDKEFLSVKYNRYWVGEAVKECYNLNEIDFLERLKKNFLSDFEKKKTDNIINSPREKLIKLIVNIANLKSYIEELYYDLDYNIKLIKTREKNFSEKIQNVLRKILNIANEEEYFHIEYINPSTKTIEKDVVNVTEFLTMLKKKIALFTEILKPTSNIYIKITRGTESALHKFLEDTYFSVLLLWASRRK